MVDQTRQNRLRLMAERQGLMIRASRLHRTACTNRDQERLDRPAGNSVVREDSPAFATVDEIAELLKSAAGRAKSSDPPTKVRPMPLGQVSEAAARLVAQEARRESKAPISAEDVSLQYAAAPNLGTSRTMAAELAPMQPLPMRRSRTVGVSGVVMLMLAATVVGFLVMFPALWQRKATDGTVDFAKSLQSVQSASVQPSVAPIPRLVVDQTRGIAGEPVPLGLTIQGRADGTVVIITGLVPGMTLSTGNTLGANVWQVPATDLANTWVGPPTDFVGMVDLIAELHLADATVLHRQPIQIEWVATSPVVAAQVPALRPIPESVPAPQQLEHAETAMEGSEDPTARIEQHGGTVAAPVPALRPIPEAVPAPQQLDHAETAMKGSKDPTARTEQHGGTAVAAQVPAVRPILEAVPAPQQLVEDEPPMDGSKDPTARTMQHGGNTHQKRVASKATASTPSKKPVKASARQRAPDVPADADQQHDVRQPSQPTQTRGDQDSGRVFIDAQGIVDFILPRRRSTEVPERASQVSTETRAQHCNFAVCARFYRSFDPSDCTYQPYSGGARKTCDR
jgi:BA14K-like protein